LQPLLETPDLLLKEHGAELPANSESEQARSKLERATAEAITKLRKHRRDAPLDPEQLLGNRRYLDRDQRSAPPYGSPEAGSVALS
jgi:hypothetical protein